MNIKIKKALVSLLNEEVMVASWGITNTKITDTSIEFEVSGFIYQGKIQLKPLDDSYNILFDTGESINCSLNDLVKTLDYKIEKTDNYESFLKEWLENFQS